LHVDGRYVKDELGRTVYLKGANLPANMWYSYPGNMQQQFAYMKQWGFTVCRIVVEAWTFPTGVLPSDLLPRLDLMVNYAETQGIYAVIGWASSWNIPASESYPAWPDATNVWKTDADWQEWINFWATIANRYKGRAHVLYDLINEPINTPENLYSTKTKACIDTIRAIDPDVVIIVMEEAYDKWTHMGFDFEINYPINRSNILFSGHEYHDHIAPQYSKEAIRSRMTYKNWDWIVNNNRAMWVGEFNTHLDWVENDATYHGATWMRNFMDVCNEMGFVGFCAWWWRPTALSYSYHNLLADWNGNPTASGKIVQEGLKA